jgi:hypothetical protein
LLGIRQGRKAGMSVEMMSTLQWICIVAAGAFLYRPFGDALADTSPMSHLFCYIAVYIIIAALVKGIFSMIKKGTGGKLAGSDVFGRGEYYLGMVAGAVRFLCILLAGLALLNAPFYSTAELAKSKAFQVEVYGSNFFPGLGAAQVQIFKESFLGSLLKNNAEFLLIASTKPESKEIKKKKDDLP